MHDGFAKRPKVGNELAEQVLGHPYSMVGSPLVKQVRQQVHRTEVHKKHERHSR